MACRQIPFSHKFETAPNETEWWKGDGSNLPYWRDNLQHPHICITPNILSKEQCQILIDCFETCHKDYAAHTGEEFWDGRYIWANNLPSTQTDALRILQQLRHFSTFKIIDHFRPNRMIYSDTAQIVRWHEGLGLTPHADNIEPNGTPNGTPHRSFSSILYLNDDYEGGETFYPGHLMRMRPKAGTLVLFGAGEDYVHGVTKVRRGLRYTYAGWFTFDRSRGDEAASLIY
jgi:2OG-Fe(II) oxygenase superfamily